MKVAWGNSHFQCREGEIHFVDSATVIAPGEVLCICGCRIVTVAHPSPRSKTVLDLVAHRRADTHQ